MDDVVTAYGLGPVPDASSTGPAAGSPHAGLAPAGGDFWRSAAFGLVLLAVIFLYIHGRIL